MKMDSPPKRPNRLSLHPSAPLGKSQDFFSCSYPDCKYKSKWEENVGRHEWGHNPTANLNIPCQVCPQVFGYLVSFLHHMTSKHSNKLFCPWCFFLGEDLDEFKAHILAHIPKPPDSTETEFPCPTCSRTFALKSNLLRHQKLKSICAVNFSTEGEQAGYGSQNFTQNSTNINGSQLDPKHLESFKVQKPKSPCEDSRRVEPDKSLLTSDTAANEDGKVPNRARTKIDLRCDKCSKTFAIKSTLLRHQKNICRIPLFHCHKCSYKTSREPDLSRHISIHLAGNELNCQNLGCTYTTLWARSLGKHQRSCKIRIPAPETSDGISNSVEILMKEVKMTEEGSEYSCCFCSFKSKYSKNLKRHLMVHVGHKLFRCHRKGCKYRTRWARNLSDHSRLVHSREKPKAPIQTKENFGLLFESEIKTEEGTVQVCHEQNLLENSTPEEPKLTMDSNCCSSSSPVAVQNENLQRILWGCDKCSFTTLYPNNLRTHGRIHSSEKPFKCPNLGCAFMTRWAKSLRLHRGSCQDRIQNPAETFDQAVVDKIKTEGTTEALTEKGKAIDGGETQFNCNICSFRSKWKPSLEAHLRVHNDTNAFRCPIEGCKYRTKWSSDLRKHLRILHHVQFPPKSPRQTEDNFGSDRDMKIEGFVSSTTIAFACVLCEFIGYSELSALKHSCEHKTAVVSLTRI